MKKGIVMEVIADHWVVMTQDGQFLKVPRKGREAILGEEVYFHRKRNLFSAGKAPWISGVVAATILFSLFFGSLYFPEQADAASYVYIDLNPSLELRLDENQDVVEIKALNPTAKQLVKGINWDGMEVKNVVVNILNRAQKTNYLDHKERVVISEVVADSEPPKTTDTLASIEKEIKQCPYLDQNRFDLYTLPLPDKIKVQAQKKGISPAKYAMGLVAKRHGKDLSAKQLATMSINDLMTKVNFSPVLRDPPSNKEWDHWIEAEDQQKEKEANESKASKPDSKEAVEEQKEESKEPLDSGSDPLTKPDDLVPVDPIQPSSPNEEKQTPPIPFEDRSPDAGVVDSPPSEESLPSESAEKPLP